MKVKEFTLGSVVALMSIAGGTFAAVNYFQSSEDSETEHLEITEYSERGKLENELKLTVLEINYLLDKQRDAADQNRLQYLNSRRLAIETRLDELKGA